MRNKIITRFLSVILAVGLSAAMFTKIGRAHV